MAGLGKSSMAKTRGRPKSKRDDATTKIDRTLLGKAHLIARQKGISVAELLSEMIRGPIDREFARIMKQMAGEVDQE